MFKKEDSHQDILTFSMRAMDIMQDLRTLQHSVSDLTDKVNSIVEAVNCAIKELSARSDVTEVRLKVTEDQLDELFSPSGSKTEIN